MDLHVNPSRGDVDSAASTSSSLKARGRAEQLAMAFALISSWIQRHIPPVCAAASAAHTGPLRGGEARDASRVSVRISALSV
ncbi:hypothetical protein WME99_32155 [Sorangium sp. So ce136]|uniref:hypothetical protein n=1 Tax=Sorangium sp. So ce136 TaxID=3133284 RepID=UPI003EFC4D0A